MFQHALPSVERFAELLAQEGVLRGLIGPREVPRLWDRHLVNCALVGQAVDPGIDVCDIGSGAGLPGLVLALARPDLQVTLVEPLLRRTTFLEEAVQRLSLDNVEVVRARAEELHGDREFSVVTSRAVAPLDRLLGWSMPLVRQSGHLIAMKGSSVQEEIAAATGSMSRLGADLVGVEEYGSGLVERPTTVVRFLARHPSALALGEGRSGTSGRTGGTPRKRKSPTRRPRRSGGDPGRKRSDGSIGHEGSQGPEVDG